MKHYKYGYYSAMIEGFFLYKIAFNRFSHFFPQCKMTLLCFVTKLLNLNVYFLKLERTF